MPTTADRRNEDARRPLHPPEKYHHVPSTRSARTKQHLQEGGDDDAAAARTSPRVSPCTQEGSEGRGVPDALQEDPTAPTGVAASGPDKPPEISPKSQPKPPPLPQTNHSAPPIAPPTNMCHHNHRINSAVSLRSPTRDLEDGRRESVLGGIRNITDVRGQPPPPLRSRPDARTRGLPGTEARPNPTGSRQPLPSRCSSSADATATARRPPPLHHQPGSSGATHRVVGPP